MRCNEKIYARGASAVFTTCSAAGPNISHILVTSGCTAGAFLGLAKHVNHE